MLTRVVALVMAGIISAGTVFAETIELNSGKTVRGVIVRQDNRSIQIDVGVETPVTYYIDEISRIVPDGQPSDEVTQADKLENQAAQVIDGGRMEEGLELMAEAIAVDPAPSRHMNYGSVLFGNGVSLFKSGNQPRAKEILKQAQVQLGKALAGFDKKKDQAYISQCYFLLGEIALNGFGDAVKAKEYYHHAVEINNHPAAKAALNKLMP